MKIVFTDLDGTLLDHFTYSYKDSLEGIKLLAKRKINLILVSSKTFAEMRLLSTKLKLKQPFIFENGAGIAFPEKKDFKIKLLGLSVEELDKKIEELSDKISPGIRTFSQMDAEEVQNRTSLSFEKAELAKKRLASLPFVITEEKQLTIDDINNINDEINNYGVTITKGGRFYHFISSTTSKGNAINYLLKILKEQNPDKEKFITMGIGDSLNDLPLLKEVDYPFAVRKHDGSILETDFAIYGTENIGPKGFTEAVKLFVEKVG